MLISLFKKVSVVQADPLAHRMLCLEIQEELIQKITASERIIKRTKDKVNSIKVMLSVPAKDKQRARILKQDLQKHKNSIERQNLLAWCLRSVGDSIAFIYGDRWDLKQLANKPNAGFISNKKGNRLERKILRRVYDKGGTAVLNDLTNSLRYGDITLFYPSLWPTGGSPFRLFEVKSGKGGDKERAKRQIEAMEAVSTYIEQDVREDGNSQWKRVGAATESTYNTKDFDRISKSTELLQNGWVLDEVEPGLFYLLVDLNSEFEPEKVFPILFPESMPLLRINANETKEKCLGYYPYPLSFNDPEILFRFYNRELLFMVFVNLDSVNAKLKNTNVSVSFNTNSDYPLKIQTRALSASDKETESFVGFHIIGRLAAEFLSLDWFVNNIIIGPLHEEILSKLNET